MVDVATMAASASLSLVVSILASLVAFEYRFRREMSHEESQEVKDWYAEAAQLANSVQRTWRTKFEGPHERGSFSGFDEIQKEMNLSASQLSRHASKSQNLDVDEEVVNALSTTADRCRDVHDLRIHMNVMDEFKQEGRQMIEQANELEEKALDRLS